MLYKPLNYVPKFPTSSSVQLVANLFKYSHNQRELRGDHGMQMLCIISLLWLFYLRGQVR